MKQVPLVCNRFLQYSGRIYVSLMSLGELYTWARRRNAPPTRYQSIVDLLQEITLLDLDHPVIEKFGEVRAHLLDMADRWNHPTCSSLRLLWFMA
jgi:hypothetical protein